MTDGGELLTVAPDDTDRSAGAPRRFRLPPIDRSIVAVTALGLVVRLAWVLSQRHMALAGDPFYYHHQADLLAHGKGFVDPLTYLVGGRSVPGADHPPLFVLYLAAWSLVGASSVLWHLVASALLGAASVFVVADAGRRLGGRRVGILTGFLAAVAPNLWLWDGIIAAETMAIFAVALFLWTVVRYLATPSRLGLWSVAGAATLAGLSRSELILLALAVVPLALRTAGLDRRLRAQWIGGAVVVVAVLVAPWAAYNQARFHQPVPLSTGLGLVLASSSCDAAWYGPQTGYWDFACSTAGVAAAGGDAAVAAARRGEATTTGADIDRRLRRVALRYVGDHATRLPAVVGARVGRILGIYRPVQQARQQTDYEGARAWLSGSIMGTWYVLAGLAVLGGLTLRRAGIPLLALTAPVSVIVFTAAFAYGIGRFRAPAEAAVVLLAAVGVDAVVRRWWEADAAPDPTGLVASFAGGAPTVGPPSVDPDLTPGGVSPG